jgi:hypothetical protein
MAALPSEPKETQDRDIVVPGDGFLATGTMGRGIKDGLPRGHAEDANVQETPEASPQKEEEDRDKGWKVGWGQGIFLGS